MFDLLIDAYIAMPIWARKATVYAMTWITFAAIIFGSVAAVTWFKNNCGL